ncbi:MAG: hypothetical protein ACQETB_05020 [Halobacteriota archaeon]
MAAQSSAPDGGFVTVGNGVSVWEGATLALHTTHPDAVDDANDTVVSSTLDRNVSVYQSELSGLANDPGAFVFADDAMVRFEYRAQPGVDTSRFAGTNVTLLAAKLESPTDPAIDGAGTVSPERAAGLLADPRRNVRASFEHVFRPEDHHSARQIDTDGSEALYYNLDSYGEGPGMYAFYVIESQAGDSVSVSDGGRLSIDGEVRVLGVDTVAVRSTDAAVETPFAAELGDTVDVTVDVDAPLGTSLHHSVLVYDPRTTNATTIEYEPDPRPFFGFRSPDDVAVRNTGGVRGSIDAHRSSSVYGTPLTDGPAAHSSELGILLSHVSSAPTSTSDDSFDASLTAQPATIGETTLEVETLSEWESGTYQYVHIASSSDGSFTAAANGTIELVEPGARFPPQPATIGHDPATADPTLERIHEDELTRLSVRSIPAGQPVLLDAGASERDDRVRVETVTVRSDTSIEEATVDVDYSIPDDADAIEGWNVVSYHTITTDRNAIDDVRATVAVDSAFESRFDIDRSAVRFVRLEDGRSLPAEPTADGYDIELGAPGTFAAVVPAGTEPPLAFSNASLVDDEIESGGEVVVRTTVENPIAEPVTTDVVVYIEGGELARETVSLDPYERRTVGVTTTIPVTGTYNISIAGTDAGELTIHERTTPTPTATTAPSNPDRPVTPIVFAVVLAVPVVAAIGSYALSRWRNGP